MNKNIYNLIVKSFKAEIKDEQELSVLNEWLSIENNRHIYVNLRAVWDKAISVSENNIIDSEQAIKRFKRELRSARLRNITRGQAILGLVAAALILLVVFFAGSYSSIVRSGSDITADWVSSIIAMSAQKSHDEASAIRISGNSGKCSTILPDGTKVILQKGATIEYKTDFGKFDRNVLVSGTAYFDVVHNDTKVFTASTQDLSVKVYGTAFTIINKENSSLVSLLRGSVSVETASGRIAKLKPGQKALHSQMSDDLTLSSTDASLDALWSLDQISFNRKSLAYVCKYLSVWYNVDIRASDKINDNFAFSFTVKDEPVEKILMLMKETSDLSYKINSDGSIKIY